MTLEKKQHSWNTWSPLNICCHSNLQCLLNHMVLGNVLEWWPWHHKWHKAWHGQLLEMLWILMQVRWQGMWDFEDWLQWLYRCPMLILYQSWWAQCPLAWAVTQAQPHVSCDCSSSKSWAAGLVLKIVLPGPRQSSSLLSAGTMAHCLRQWCLGSHVWRMSVKTRGMTTSQCE